MDLAPRPVADRKCFGRSWRRGVPIDMEAAARFIDESGAASHRRLTRWSHPKSWCGPEITGRVSPVAAWVLAWEEGRRPPPFDLAAQARAIVPAVEEFWK